MQNKTITTLMFMILVSFVFSFGLKEVVGQGTAQPSINTSPIEGAKVDKIKKNCIATADPKNKNKLEMGRTDFINTTSMVRGGGQKILSCKSGRCNGAAPANCYVDVKRKFQPKQRLCCEKVIRGNKGMECDPGKEPTISTDQVEEKLRKFVNCNSPRTKEMIESIDPKDFRDPRCDRTYNLDGSLGGYPKDCEI